MRALGCPGPGHISWDTVLAPVMEEATDAIVRVDATTVCGSDLHILRGDLPEVKPGTVLGHEAVGEVVETGRDVHGPRPGNQVIVSSLSACGGCQACRDTGRGQCSGGGGLILGNRINGTQAEFVRAPHRLRGRSTERTRRPWRHRRRGGRWSGPVGLATVSVARLYPPRRIIVADLSEARLEVAARMGADVAELPGKMIAELPEERAPTSPSRHRATQMASSCAPRPSGREGTSPTSGRTADRPRCTSTPCGGRT